MGEIAAIQRQLKIKYNVVQRYKNEVKFDHEEKEGLEKKLERLVRDGAEDWDIKNTKNMIEESNKTILSIESKLDKAIGDLNDLVERVKEESGVADTEEFKNAEQILAKAGNPPA